MVRGLMSDEEWAFFEPFAIEKGPRRGRRPKDHRQVLNGMEFKSQGSAQWFLSSHAAVYNTFNIQPDLISRPGLRALRAQAHEAWAVATEAA